MSLIKLSESAVLGMQVLIFFCLLLLVMSSVNFDVCSIAFVMYLLNGVPFSIFVLIQQWQLKKGCKTLPISYKCIVLTRAQDYFFKPRLWHCSKILSKNVLLIKKVTKHFERIRF